MFTPAKMAERQGRMLAELGELGLALARDLQGRALAAETPQEAAQLADAFHRISRSVRQSLALEAKLKRESVRDERDRRDDEARETEARRAARQTELRKRVERMIRTEGSPELADLMLHEVPDIVRLEAESESFLDEPVEAQIARIREALGVDEDWALVAEDDEDGDPDATEEADDAGPGAALEPAVEPPPDSSPPESPYGHWRDSA
jgi:hypothetical protein